MKQILKAVCGSILAVGGAGLGWAQSAPPEPLPPVPPAPLVGDSGQREIRIIERNVDFLGSRRGGRDAVFETWEMTPQMLGRMADELGLSPAQQGKITELMATYRPKLRELREQFAKESRQFRDIGPDTQDFDAMSKTAANKVGSLSAALVEQGSALRKEVWNVLTPEQRKTLQQRQSQMRERMQDRRERWQKRWERRPERDKN